MKFDRFWSCYKPKIDPVKIEIRVAIRKDIPILLKYSQSIHYLSAYRHHKYSRRSVASWFEFHINNSRSIILVAIYKSNIVGVFIGHLLYEIEQEAAVLSESFFYIKPQFRKYGTAIRIIKKVKLMAKRSGAVAVRLSSTARLSERTVNYTLILGRKNRQKILVKQLPVNEGSMVTAMISSYSTRGKVTLLRFLNSFLIRI